MLSRVAPALFVLFWSTGFIVARAVATHADVQFFLLCRFAAAAALWGIVASLGIGRWPSPQRTAQHVATGAAMMGLYLCLSFWAIAQGLPAGVMALMGALQPLFTAALVFARRREPPSVWTWFGQLIGLSGVVLVLLPRMKGSQVATTYLAALAGLLAIMAVTFGALAQKRLADDDLRIANCIQNIGATCVALIAVIVVGTVRFDRTPVLWGLLLWSILVTSVFAQGLLLWMVRRTGAAHVTVLMLLVPPVAALLAYGFFRETLTPLQLAGFALALGGVVIARRKTNADSTS